MINTDIRRIAGLARIAAGLCLCCLITAPALAGPDTSIFAAHFLDETLRVDYTHTGDAKSEIVALDTLWRQGAWAGSRVHLIDDLDLGRYYAKVYDRDGETLLFSRGFDSYFGEWQTTAPAADGVQRSYDESILCPFPRHPVVFCLETRGSDGLLREIYRVTIDPEFYGIREDALPDDLIVVEAAIGGDPHSRVDVVILGEGYTAAEEAKFRRDLAHFSAVMLAHEPYKSLADRFNIRGVLKPSQQSGCDEPSRGVHRRTALGCTFDSLGSERYMLTEDNRALRDAAAAVPYDALYVMVNHERYGGGGIYNLFNTFTSDNQWSDYVFLHEFGHHFAGLADEYYTSDTAYNDFYPPGVEPSERNITALADPHGLKWRDQVSARTPIPTPWNKDEYDAMDRAYQETRRRVNTRIATLMRNHAPAAEVEAAKAEGETLSKSHQQEIDAWFARNPARDQVGAFMGAGYSSEGLYRSQLDCIMFSKGVKPFCAACRRGIIEVIEHYGE